MTVLYMPLGEVYRGAVELIRESELIKASAAGEFA
jgi:hypothetical protein